MWEVEELALDLIEVIVREQLRDANLTDPELHQLNGQGGSSLLVHSGLLLKNASSFSATSSIPPKNS